MSGMKRYSDGNMGGPFKRSRLGPDDVEIRLLIPSKLAGSIIGKGGKNISRLRSDYKASVTVPDCPGPERILTLGASEVENIIKIINEIVPSLEDHNGRGGRGGDEADVRMLVHQSQAGCIIGKAGLKVKELREKTGARIKIYTNCCPQSTDRVVQVTGRGDTCANCIELMIELLRSVPVKGVDNQYDPINYDDVYADEYGGYGQGNGGGGGGGGRGGGGMMGRDMDDRDMGGRDMGGRDMGSRGRSYSSGRGGGMGMGSGGRGSGGGGYSSSGGGGGGGYGGGGWIGNGNDRFDDDEYMEQDDEPMGFGFGNGNRRNNSTQAQVTIPKDLAGAIIGKGGARIQKIRLEAGAGITIEEPLPGSNDRVITITGQPKQIKMAQYLLQQSVHQNSNEARNNRF